MLCFLYIHNTVFEDLLQTLPPNLIQQINFWGESLQFSFVNLVTTFGLADNQYSSIFQNTVTLKDLFK